LQHDAEVGIFDVDDNVNGIPEVIGSPAPAAYTQTPGAVGFMVSFLAWTGLTTPAPTTETSRLER
jgi:hypothetical protein